MAPRNRVKKRIFMDIYSSTRGRRRSTAATVVSSGAESSSLRDRSVITGATTDAATVVVAGAAGANSSSLPEGSVTADPHTIVLQTGSPMMPAEWAVMTSTGKLSISLATGVDESLDAGPALTRSNPTASILAKVPSADSLVYEGSKLYKDENGDWVVGLVPENIAESNTSSRTQMMGERIDVPTPTIL